MHTVGEKLKRARLEKGVSFEEVYRITRIHPQVLEALEQDQADARLDIIYIKGFLKSYARFLGLDAEALVQEYISGHKIKPAPLQSKPAPEKKRKKRKLTVKLNPFLTFRVVLAAVLFIGFIFYFRFVAQAIPKIKVTRPAVKQPLKKVKVRVVPAPKIEKTTKATKNKPVQSEFLVLEVKTLDACWLRVKADGESIFARTLAKGKKERWKARDKLELRIGKPEALEVFLNGEPIDLKAAKVKRSLIITREGIKGK